MKILCLLSFIIYLNNVAFAQNVGIGTSSPSRAKLTVSGTASTGSSTVALFASGWGLSMQDSLPAIGFNQYRPNAEVNGYSISTGYGLNMAFDPSNGNFAINRNGNSRFSNTLFPLNEAIIGWLDADKSLRLNAEIADGRLDVANKIFATQSGKFNLVPLGILKVKFNFEEVAGYTILVENQAGLAMQSFTPASSGDKLFANIVLNPTLIAGYTDFVPVHAFTFSSTYNGTLAAVITNVFNHPNGNKILELGVRFDSITPGMYMDGHVILYGIQ